MLLLNWLEIARCWVKIGVWREDGRNPRNVARADANRIAGCERATNVKLWKWGVEIVPSEICRLVNGSGWIRLRAAISIIIKIAPLGGWLRDARKIQPKGLVPNGTTTI
jgi:hypothetical protein